MKKFIQFLFVFVFGFSGVFVGAQAKYTLEGEYSAVHFSSIKKQYIVEPAVFQKVSGSISDSGDVEVSIDLNSIETRIPIRNERINKLFFESVKFPNATVKAKIDMGMLKGITDFKKMEIPATLNFYGKSKPIKLKALIAKVGKDKFVVTSMSPTIVNAKDFGIPDNNITKLAATVGGFSISSKVGVSFVLSFTAK
jgi:polyisoprenoid-binding protein YceI